MIEIDIEFVKSLAREAGDAALTRCGKVATELKADGSYVTEIDRDTEKFLRGRLAERYPEFSFQGEEYGRYGEVDVPLWAVDPIDGTTNMVFGLPIWCVSIGLIAEGLPVAGVVYLPRTGELFWGERGKGAFCNGTALRPRDREELHLEDTVGFTSTAIKTLDISLLTGRIRCLGSIAAEVVYTAHGLFCSHVGCHEGANDLAAALCIAHEAGCEAIYLNGDTFDVDTIVREGQTRSAFIVAPPRMAALLQKQLQLRR